MKKNTFFLCLLSVLACFSPTTTNAVSFGLDDISLQKLNAIVQDGIKSLKESTPAMANAFGNEGTRNIKCFFLAAVGAVLAVEGLYLIHTALTADEKNNNNPTANPQLIEALEAPERARPSWHSAIKPTCGALFFSAGLYLIFHSTKA